MRLKVLEQTITSFSHQATGRDPHQVTAINLAMWNELNPIGYAGFFTAVY
ncbi:MAG: hypothetical protein KTR18_12595 [Acidiferrobacterales bacterium]|nr:hypothetical protein [Acidiferrobacterales bacterium]